MPLHEYRCGNCGKEFEELVALNEEKNPPCPACDSGDTQRKISSCANLGSSSSCGSSGFT